MTCLKIKKIIHQSMDAELNSQEMDELSQHLEGCSKCKSFYQDLLVIRTTAPLLNIRKPDKDLWPDIRKAISGDDRASESKLNTFWKNPSLILKPHAISICVIFFIFISGFYYLTGINEHEKYQDLRSQVTDRYDLEEILYLSTIRELDMSRQLADFESNSDIYLVFQKNLEIIESSIQECRDILKGDPDNLMVRKFLVKAYRNKADLLTREFHISGT